MAEHTLLGGTEDHDLTKSQAGGPTIESSLNETAGHLAEHAQQIQAAIK